VKDLQIRSLGYERTRGRLEIEFTWTDDVRQFYCISAIARVEANVLVFGSNSEAPMGPL
jgi:hypothetical protein